MRTYHKNKTGYTMRAGWTFIELIFIIVIIGILASLAITKLSTTRDDAKLSACVSNMLICIKDANAHYTATQIDYSDALHSSACDKNQTKCYDFTYAVNGVDFNVTTNSTREGYCADIEYVGGHLARSYDFGGQSVIR